MSMFCDGPDPGCVDVHGHHVVYDGAQIWAVEPGLVHAVDHLPRDAVPVRVAGASYALSTAVFAQIGTCHV